MTGRGDRAPRGDSVILHRALTGIWPAGPRITAIPDWGARQDLNLQPGRYDNVGKRPPGYRTVYNATLAIPALPLLQSPQSPKDAHDPRTKPCKPTGPHWRLTIF